MSIKGGGAKVLPFLEGGMAQKVSFHPCAAPVGDIKHQTLKDQSHYTVRAASTILKALHIVYSLVYSRDKVTRTDRRWCVVLGASYFTTLGSWG